MQLTTPITNSATLPVSKLVDVAIVGGGAAGLAAALQLGRSRRSVLVIDGGKPRNAPAGHMQSYLGHDGRPPLEFLEIGKAEVRSYGVDVWEHVRAEVSRDRTGLFRVACSDGGSVLARRVIAASGVTDVLPDIPGLADLWGRFVIHCPFCHGWEVRDRPIVVIATSEAGWHQAQMTATVR